MNSKVNWGAILAGAMITLASTVFFSLLALAVGVGSINVTQPLAPQITWPGAIYTMITAMGSFALGGYCTVRLGGIRDAGLACLHALTSFSVAGALVPFLASRGTFLTGVPGFPIASSAGMFISLSLAWLLFFTFGLASVAAAAGGVWGSRELGAVVTRTHATEILEAEREEKWPAA